VDLDRRFVILLVSATLMLAACTVAGAGPTVRPAPGPADLVFVATDAGPAALDARTGSVIYRNPGAVPQADWSELYATEPADGGGTTLRTIAPGTGAVAASVRLDGELAIRAVAGDGSMVALMTPRPLGTDPWTPVPRSRTTIVVADPTGTSDPVTYHLKGNLEPEAFSTDGKELFVIQYLPPSEPSLYRVAEVELDEGDVYPVFGRDKSWAQRMPGTRLEQVLAPDGRQLYTLYSSQPASYAGGYDAVEAGTDGHVAFVHVLNLEDNWAFCVGLPKALWDAPAGEQAMAASPDGTKLFVVDPSRDAAVVMNAKSTRVSREVTVPFATDSQQATATMSPDGESLYVGTGDGVTALDATTLEVLDRWATDGAPTGLAMSADGARLYASFGDRVSVLDPATGSTQRTYTLDGATAVEHVAPA
jgi:DNA-binding beta-propeller fold protein YncE